MQNPPQRSDSFVSAHSEPDQYDPAEIKIQQPYMVGIKDKLEEIKKRNEASRRSNRQSKRKVRRRYRSSKRGRKSRQRKRRKSRQRCLSCGR